jgi:hypothetical protein
MLNNFFGWFDSTPLHKTKSNQLKINVMLKFFRFFFACLAILSLYGAIEYRAYHQIGVAIMCCIAVIVITIQIKAEKQE